MYTVLSDDVVLHDSTSPDLDFHLIDPKLVIGDSIAGTLTITVPPNNNGYSSLNRMTSTIVVKKETSVLWTGRVIKETKDYWNRRKVVAEGALAFLNDTNQPVKTYKNTNLRTFISRLLSEHNSKVGDNRKVTMGSITVTDMDDDHIYQTNYGSTWDEFKENCLDRLGGHVRIRYNTGSSTPIFDYLKDYPNTASQEINFGENLLDFTRDWDLSDLTTVIIPRGARLDEETPDGQTDYVTVKSVNDNSIYVINQNAYNNFGRIERIVDFPDVESPSVLLDLANLYISNQQFDEMVMEINAVDLHRLIGGSTPNPVAFKLLDEVRCISKPHGLDRMFPITGIEIPLDSPDKVVYTMGATASGSLSGSIKSDMNMVFQRIKNIPSYTNVLGLAKQQAAELLNQRTTGYITITELEESSQALIVSETKNWQNARKYWMFNMNGLGYTKDGGQTYDVAMTMDGSIVADFVRTGVLEDGYGLNYWNLSTGEFSLGYNTEFRESTDPSSPVLTIGGVNNTAVAANTTATQAKNQQVGGTNLLIDTNWSKTTKRAATDSRKIYTNGSSNVTLSIIKLAANARPVGGAEYAFQAVFKANQNAKYGYIQYYNTSSVNMKNSQKYTVSCWARLAGGSAKIKFQYGNTSFKAGGDKALTSAWKRYSWTFTFNQTSAGGSNGAKIYFIASSTSDTATTVQITGMKLEVGDKATDWSMAPEDVNYGYTVAEANAEGYTNQQLKELDDSFNQAKVFNRLTDNGRRKGIVLSNGELYINGTYIQTNTLKAGIIKAGILSDQKGLNKWNLDTGYFTTNKGILKDCTVDGALTSKTTAASESAAITMAFGQLHLYNLKNKLVGGFGAVIDSSKPTYQGIFLKASKDLDLTIGGKLYITTKNVKSAAITGNYMIGPLVYKSSNDKQVIGFINISFSNGICTKFDWNPNGIAKKT